ncbi:MAG TPA: preprotein translocase subunit SecE, partial [Abditibacteriaceae bacterium]|nr:preprotein translocase subunit SecE [Abditibacteriaceae bacterium]
VARPVTGRTLAPSRTQAPAKRGDFFKDTAAELRRVVWPPRAQVRSGTIVTIGLLIFFGLYISGLDRLIEGVFSAIGLYADRGPSIQ